MKKFVVLKIKWSGNIGIMVYHKTIELEKTPKGTWARVRIAHEHGGNNLLSEARYLKDFNLLK